MSQMPAYLAEDNNGNMWSDRTITTAEAYAEGRSFQKKYLEDAQMSFSRVQHHFHEKTRKGYRPHAYLPVHTIKVSL